MEADFKRVLDNCLDILRDNEGVTGEKALRNMSYLLTLALIEPRLGSELDLFDPNQVDLRQLEPYELETYQKYSKFSNLNRLSEAEQHNFITVLNAMWEDILSQHSATKNIFQRGNKFDIERKTTIVKLVQKIDSLNFAKENVHYDVLGAAYERVIASVMTGKVLGQFFTPCLLKDIMMQYIQPKVLEDGTCESVCDPTMGTAGFLTSYTKYIIREAREKGIQLDWKKIVEKGLIYGKEIDAATFQLGASNMLISTGHIFQNLQRGDSIRDPIEHMKFDYVLSNPPFGIKGLEYTDFYSPIKGDYLPIKSNNAVSLFIQAIIYMLKIGGKCAVVLPDGQDLFSKTNKTLVAVREYLMRTCDLQDVINIPGGAFENTSIKTCLAIFQKKIMCIPVMGKKIYKFDSVCHTNAVRFSVLDISTKKVDLVSKVPIERIMENMWSLNVAEYVEQKSEIPLCIGESGQKFEMKTLGEICHFIRGQMLSRTDMKPGIYPVIGGGKNPSGFHNEFNMLENTILCSASGAGTAGYISRYSRKVWASDCFAITHGFEKNENISLDYIFYYLKLNQDEIYKFKKGTCQAHVNPKDISALKVIIPPLATQAKIVEYLDFINENLIKKSQDAIAALRQANEFRIRNQIQYGQNEVRTLGEIIKINGNGKTNTKDITNTGEYPFYSASAQNPSGTNIKYDFDGEKYLLIIKSGGSSKNPISNNYGIGKVFLVSGKCSANIAVFQLLNISNNNIKFIYYFLLSIQNEIQKLAKYAVNNGNIDFKSFFNIQIPLPDLAIQQQIVDYCDDNQKTIDSLEAKIKANKELAKTYLASVLGLQQTEPHEYSASAENLTDSDVSPEIEAEVETEAEAEEYTSPAKKQKQEIK
jgi:type I restriction-modification system DNA methylase subunit/restriction endonuclease S subunit